ncbi:hypothetical protein Tco_0688851 [Tanacetum coccineum]
MASLDYRLNPMYTIKECSSCGSLYNKGYCCSNCLNEGWFTIHDENEILNTSESSNDDTNVVSAPQEPFVVKQDPGKNSSQSPPHIDHNCCYECGDSLDDIFCQRCTCKSCGKGAHYGYNCPPQIPIISNPEPCYNQNLNEILQNLQSLQQQCLFGTCQQCGCNEYDGVCFYCTIGNGTPITFSTPYSSNDSPSFANHPPQNFQNFQQQYPCCENYGGPHETYQCQPMNEDYYHEQNSCYDPNSFGFDQFQPPQYTVNHPIFNARNELLNSQNKLMEQISSICDMVGQYMQKNEEEKRIAEDQAAKDRYGKIPICYDNDDEEESFIPLKDIIISRLPPNKSSVEELVPIPSESEGIPDKMCDLPLCDNPTPLEAFKEHSKIVVNSNDDSTSSDDDSPYDEDIDYVDASPPDSELVSLEVVEIVILEVGGIDTDILLTIKDDILREKLLNVNLLIAKIKALKDNPTQSSNFVTKSPFTFLNFFLEETNTFDNSIPKSETFCFDLEENSSGSTTTRSDYSLPNYEAFYLDDDHIEEKSSGKYDHFYFKIESDLGNFTMDVVEDIFDNPSREPRVHVPNVVPTHPTLHLDSDFTLSSDSLGSDLAVSFPFGTRNNIFDPGIFIGVQSMRFLSLDEFSISFIRDLSSPVIGTFLPFSLQNKDKVFNLGILAVGEEQSPHLSSHRGLKALNESPMMISGGDTPILEFRFSISIPLDQLKYGGSSQAQDSVNKNKRFMGGNPCLS